MRAGDLTPGWYSAHNSGKRDCHIEKVERIDEQTVDVTYTYAGCHDTRRYSNYREWAVRPYFTEYVIEEMGCFPDDLRVCLD